MSRNQHHFVCIFLILLSVLISLSACRGPTGSAPKEKNGQVYGVTDGLFRHRWWNYYERGVSYADGDFWQEAAADFRTAIEQRDADVRRARTYGMHFVDYFPHRELGVALFYQNRYEAAIRELETSLATEASARAAFYLDRARQRWIDQKDADKAPPAIALSTPSPDTLTNRLDITVTGTATDDTFVRSVQVNGSPVRVDLSAPEITFTADVQLRPGENTVTVDAVDLAGKSARHSMTVHCDRAGPILNIDALTRHPDIPGAYQLRGYAYDTAGITAIQVNEQPVWQGTAPETRLDHTVQIAAGTEAVVTARDRAGNETRARLETPSAGTAATDRLLAALDGFSATVTDLSPPLFRGMSRIRETSEPEPAPSDSPLLASTNLRGGNITPTMFKNHYVRPYVDRTRYYALIIGINDYVQWPRLQTAVNDAVAMREILIGQYGFPATNVFLRRDREATRSAIITDLRHLAAGLQENDALLVYYAGHGQIDDLVEDGYWVPSEGAMKDPTTWITNSTIRDILSAEKVKARNILVISDSCYSGSLTRGGVSSLAPRDVNYQKRALELAYRKSRQVITSGGNEPVADGGRDGHSLFAYYLLKALTENRNLVMDLENLVLSHVWKPVSEIGGQRPTVGRLRTPMDEGGQFVIIRSGNAEVPAISELTARLDEQRTEVPPSPETTLSVADSLLPDTTPPTLEVQGWNEKRTVFLDRVYLQGNVRDDGGVQNLTINGEKVLRRPGRNVYFNYLADLRDGENEFEIECADPVGNEAEEQVEILRKRQKVYDLGARMSMAIYPFTLKGSRKVAVEDILLKHLTGSDRFFVKEWKMAAETNRPLNPEAVDENAAIDLARKLGVEFVVTGVVTAKDETLEITARVVETETLDVLTFQDVYGESPDRELIEKLCQGLVVKLEDALPMAEGKVVKVKRKEVIVNLGEEQRLKKGMHLIFFEEGEPLLDPDTGEELGADVEEYGAARVERIRTKLSHAVPFEEVVVEDLREGLRFVTK